MNKLIRELESSINHNFKNKDLIQKALTHKTIKKEIIDE